MTVVAYCATKEHNNERVSAKKQYVVVVSQVNWKQA